MTRKATLLFAVTLAGGTAAADPVQPRTLATGAPACGNMPAKYGLPVACTTPTPAPKPKKWTASVTPGELGYAVVMTVVREAKRIGRHLANTPAASAT